MRTTEVPVELIDLGSHIPFKCFTSKSHCHRTRKCRYTLRPNLTSTGSGKITHVADEIYAYLSDIANYIQENYLTVHWNTNNIVFPEGLSLNCYIQLILVKFQLCVVPYLAL